MGSCVHPRVIRGVDRVRPLQRERTRPNARARSSFFHGRSRSSCLSHKSPLSPENLRDEFSSVENDEANLASLNFMGPHITDQASRSQDDVEYTNDLVPCFVGECRHHADVLIENRPACGRIQILGRPAVWLRLITTPTAFVGERYRCNHSVDDIGDI